MYIISFFNMYMEIHQSFGNIKVSTARIHMATVLCRFEVFPSWIVFVIEAQDFVR
jgi:hypothetical protein